MPSPRVRVLIMGVAALLAVPAVAAAHPASGDDAKDFGDFDGSPAYQPGLSSHGNADLASPNMWHTANVMNPQVTNSDLAFWKGGADRKSVV
jgi:hypothetical protein